MLHQVIHCLCCATHVAHLSHQRHPIGMECLGISKGELILCGAWQCDIHSLLPGFASGEEGCLGITLSIRCHYILATESEAQHVIYLLATYALGVIDITVGATQCHHLGSHLCGFLGGSPCHISKAGDGHGASRYLLSHVLQHLSHEVQSSIACGFGSKEGTSKLQTLAGEGTCVLPRKLLVHAKHVSHFTATHTDVACRYILIGAQIAPQLQHEGLTEAHDFSFAASARAEVGTSFASTHGQGSEGILEGLLKAQELQYTQIY